MTTSLSTTAHSLALAANINGDALPSAALEAALQAVAAAPDSGLLLLPETPTHDMIEAARLVSDLPASEILAIWDAMVAAW